MKIGDIVQYERPSPKMVRNAVEIVESRVTAIASNGKVSLKNGDTVPPDALKVVGGCIDIKTKSGDIHKGFWYCPLNPFAPVD